MIKLIRFLILDAVISWAASLAFVIYILNPLIKQYPRIQNLANHWPHANWLVGLLFFIALFFVLVQIYYRKISLTIAFILYPVYFFLLFIFLFEKNRFNALHGGFVPNPLKDVGQLNEKILNFIAFIPFGLIYYSLKWWQVLIVAIFAVTGIETVQYMLAWGVFSTFDIIENVAGILVGYGVLKFWVFKCKVEIR
ncbi:MAG: VanZ family protein [Lactobacillales bacterium]|nr:VanZ family protein [Lactobacillales bacterium]